MFRHRKVTQGEGPKRILYAITKASWGGAQRYVYDLAVAAKEAGHEVLVVSGTAGPLTERLIEAGIATEVIGSMQRDIKLVAEFASFRALSAAVARFRPDVIHGNSSKAGALAALAGRLAGTRRILFTAHGWAFNERRPSWQKAIIALMHYATVLLAHRTICVSHAIQMDASWMPFAQKRLTVIHNGVSEHPLCARDETRMRLAPELVRLFPNALWIGAVAELHPTKGLDLLIEAFSHAVREHPAAVLVLIGDGEEWAHLTKLIQIYDLPERIVLAGFVADAATYLPALDIFALPSRSEALGYAFLEAGLASLPAVGTRVGGIPEILIDGKTGLLVPPEDPRALSDALVSLLKDADLRTRLGRALYDSVCARFTTRTMIEKTLALYAR